MLQHTRFFRTLSSMDGTLFNVLGKGITIRQAAILGVGCGFIVMMALRTENMFLIPLVLIPIIFGVARTKTMTADQYISTLLSYSMHGGSSTKRIKVNRAGIMAKKIPSQRLGLHQENVKKMTKKKKEIIMKIPVIDKRKPVRLNVTILGHDGLPYANQFVSIYLDDIRIAAVSTDSTGKTAVTVIPNKFGVKSLRVMPRNSDDPLLDEMVEFVDE